MPKFSGEGKVTLLPSSVCLNSGPLSFWKCPLGQSAVRECNATPGRQLALEGFWQNRSSPSSQLEDVFPRGACWGRVYLGQMSCVENLSAGSPFQVRYPPSGYAHPWTPPAWPSRPGPNLAVDRILQREGIFVLRWVPRLIGKILVWDRKSGSWKVCLLSSRDFSLNQPTGSVLYLLKCLY